MAYCTVSDVEFFTRVSYDTDTEPTLNQVENWINIIADEIKFALDVNKIAEPDSGEAFYSILKKYNAIGVVGLILSGNQSEVIEGEEKSSYWTEYKTFLNNLNEGKYTNYSTAGYISNQITDGTETTDSISYNKWEDDFDY